MSLTSTPWALVVRHNAKHGEHFEITAIEGRLTGMAMIYTGEEDALVMAASREMLDSLIQVTDCLTQALTGGAVSAAKAGAALSKAGELLARLPKPEPEKSV